MEMTINSIKFLPRDVHHCFPQRVFRECVFTRHRFSGIKQRAVTRQILILVTEPFKNRDIGDFCLLRLSDCVSQAPTLGPAPGGAFASVSAVFGAVVAQLRGPVP